MHIIELCLYCASEYGALQARDISRNHGGLIYAVQNPGHCGKEIWFEDLCVLEQSKRVARVKPDGSSKSNDRQLNNSLCPYFERVRREQLTANKPRIYVPTEGKTTS
jgi:hypothetical protein